MANTVSVDPYLAYKIYTGTSPTWTTTGSTTTTWSHWNQPQQLATSSNTTTWVQWTMKTVTSTCATIDTLSMTWRQWTTVDGRVFREPIQPPILVQPGVVTPEQVAAQLARDRVRQQACEAYEAKQRAIREKAERTLLSLLTPEQEQAWRENRAIFVTSQSGKRYRLKEGMTHNMHEVDAQNQLLKELCVHVDFSAKCPVIDNLIAQLLGLRFNESILLKRANIWDCQQPHRPLIQEAER